MSRKPRDPTPAPGEVRRAFIGMYIGPKGMIEERLVCSICVVVSKPTGKRMAALVGTDNVCEGCGCALV